jgi:predicted small secreted protein
MKRKLLIVAASLFALSGCATWSGVKTDSKAVYSTGKDVAVDVKDGAVDVYKDTKSGIHKATE